MATVNTLLNQYQKMADEARLSNLTRQKAIESIFDEIISRYGPGGGFGKGYEAELGKQKVRDVGAASQRDIGRGLYGIRPYEAEWESTTGAGARLKLEDIKMERLSSAQMGKAGFMERIEQPYPDYGPLASAYSAGVGGGGGRVIPSSQGFLPSGGRTEYGAVGEWNAPIPGNYTPGGVESATSMRPSPSTMYSGNTPYVPPTGQTTTTTKGLAGTAGGTSYPSMAEALKQGVGAIGTDSKGTPYRLTSTGWVKV